MGYPQYNTQVLIENIQRRCSVPTSQLTFTDEDFVLLANDELQGEVIPLMMSTREEYFVHYEDIPLPNDGVIEFPQDAIGSKLRSVCYVQQQRPLFLVNLPRIDLDVVAGVGWANNTSIAGFYVQNNSLVIWPNNNLPTGNTIRVYYYKRSLVLAPPSGYAQIVSVDENNSSVVVTALPNDWEVGMELNAVSSTANFAITNSSCEITVLSNPTITLDTVEGIQVGDYLSEKGYSAIPQVPIEAHAYLAQLTAVKCLEALGDQNGMQNAQMKADKLKTGILITTSQRVDGSVKKVVNPNGGLRLGSGLGRWGRGSSGGAY